MCYTVKRAGMKRTEKLTTSVTPEEKQHWKILAAELGYSTPADMLREVAYDHLEENEYETSREGEEGNPKAAAVTAD
jgi:hypothetical protein